MEGVSASVCATMRGYWRRRGYKRINGLGRWPRNRAELGSNQRRRRFWRIKIKPKLKVLKLASPKKFFVWLRDAYVKMMLGLANTSAIGTGYVGVTGNGIGSFGQGPLKEYDEKMIIEIYKSLVMTQDQLVPRNAAKLGSLTKLAAIAE